MSHPDKSQPTSDTPRTDAECAESFNDHVHSDFARQLERELAEAKRMCELADIAVRYPLSAIAPPADPEHDALVKDAARYRWWREHWIADDEDKFDQLNDVLKSDDPDQDIDAAMASTDGGTK